jgi:TPR repeat protein
MNSPESNPNPDIDVTHDSTQNASSTLNAPTTDQGDELYERGMAFIHGSGVEQNYGMAIASFLDGMDMGHADCTIKASLIYYLGAGISRNAETAKQYARQYLKLKPDGEFGMVAGQIVRESLDVSTARSLLLDQNLVESAPSVVVDPVVRDTSNRSRVILISSGIFVVFILVIAGVLFRDKLFSKDKSPQVIANNSGNADNVSAEVNSSVSAVVESSAGDSDPHVQKAQGYLSSHDFNGAIHELSPILNVKGKSHGQVAYLISQAYAGLGNKLDAIRYLRMAIAEQAVDPNQAMVNPAYENIRTDIEFVETISGQ